MRESAVRKWLRRGSYCGELEIEVSGSDLLKNNEEGKSVAVATLYRLVISV
jgi:hypothetical protein